MERIVESGPLFFNGGLADLASVASHDYGEFFVFTKVRNFAFVIDICTFNYCQSVLILPPVSFPRD